MADVTHLSDGDFADKVLKSSEVWLIDFWAEWCGPCRMVAPTIEELASDFAGRALIGKVNTDDCPHVSREYGITRIPTLLIFKDGKVVEEIIGLATKKNLSEKIEAHLTK